MDRTPRGAWDVEARLRRRVRLAYEVGVVVAASSVAVLVVTFSECAVAQAFSFLLCVLVTGFLILPVLGRDYLRAYLWAAGLVALGYASFAPSFDESAGALQQALKFTIGLVLVGAPLSLPLLGLAARGFDRPAAAQSGATTRTLRIVCEVGAIAMGPVSVVLSGKMFVYPVLPAAAVVPGLLVVPLLGRRYVRPYLWCAGTIGVSTGLAQMRIDREGGASGLVLVASIALLVFALALPLVLLGLREGVGRLRRGGP